MSKRARGVPGRDRLDLLVGHLDGDLVHEMGKARAAARSFLPEMEMGVDIPGRLTAEIGIEVVLGPSLRRVTAVAGRDFSRRDQRGVSLWDHRP